MHFKVVLNGNENRETEYIWDYVCNSLWPYKKWVSSWGGRKGRSGCKYEKGPPKVSIMPTKQLRCMPSIKEGGQGFRVNLRHIWFIWQLHSCLCCLLFKFTEGFAEWKQRERGLPRIYHWGHKRLVWKKSFYRKLFHIAYCQNLKIVTVLLGMYK
jgi:hypothetical protein